MARLPSVADLGNRPVPVSNRQVASVRNADAVGEAVSQVGDQLQTYGNQQLEKQDKLDYATAKTSLLSADINMRQQLQNDPDYATYEQRYNEAMGKARQAALSQIKNSSDRRAFEIDTQLDTARGLSEVRDLAQKKQTATEIGNGLSSLDELRAAARNAPDDETRVQSVKTAGQIIQGMIAKGMDPIKAAQLKDEWGSGYAAGQVSSKIDQGDYAGARTTMKSLQGFLSDEAFISLNHQLDGAENDQKRLGDIDAVMAGGRSTAAPASVPSIITSLFPNAHITSLQRSPAEQAALIAQGATKARNSYHLTGNAADVRPIPGVTFQQYVAGLKSAGVNVVEAIDETHQGTGPHWHVAWQNGRVGTPPQNTDQAVSMYRSLHPDATAEDISKARSEFATRFEVTKQAKDQREETAVETAQQLLVNNGGNWFSLPPSVRAMVPAKYHDDMISFGNSLRSGQKPATDPNTYVKLSEMAATHPAQFAALNPIQYRNSLDDGDWEKMVAERNRILGKADSQTDAASIATVRSVIDPLRKAKGLTTIGLNPNLSSDVPKIEAINGRVYNLEKTLLHDIQIWQQNNPGKKPGAEDIQKMADRRMIAFTQGDNEMFGFEAKGEGQVHIPQPDFDRISKLMAPILGRQPSGTEVYAAYLAEARQ